MFLADEPIQSAADDRLGRKPFAHTLAEAILAQKGIEPLVIGLLGPWGSGKSSILRMTMERICEKTEQLPDTERPVLVDFRPWMVADHDSLVTQFFDEVISAIGQVNYAKALKRVERLFNTYSGALTPFGFIPTPVGKAVGAFPKLVQGILGLLKWLLTVPDGPQAQKAKLDEALKAQPNKLIIFIDEIDRLTASETKQLFQVVKSLANFPNTVYVLAFDESVVEKQLGETVEGGGAFLDKIVQVPFHVPQIRAEDVHRYVRESLLHAFSKWGDDVFDRQHFHFLMRHGVERLVRTLRDAKRFLNVVVFNANTTKGRVRLSDLIGMTAIQVLEPAVFEAIRHSTVVLLSKARPTQQS